MLTISEHNIFIFLFQVFLLLGLARGLGELFKKIKQPPMTAEILVGVVLGPTIFGRFFPAIHGYIFPRDVLQMGMLETVAWLGVLFLLLEIGLEVDFYAAWRHRGDALKIAVSDLVIPIVLSFLACFFIPSAYLVDPSKRIIFSFFMATVMAITGMPVVARTLHDLKLSKTDLGFLIMTALSVNDILGWLIFTVILGFFMQTGLDIGRVALVAGSTIAFSFFCLTAGRSFTDSLIEKIKERQMPQPATTLTLICLMGLFCGAVTQKLGISAIFGFFLAGIMAGSARALSEKTRQVISQMVYAIFVPLFFASIGLEIDFFKNFNVLLVLLISGVSILTKFLGAWFGVGLTRQPRSNRFPISVAHTPGGAMQIVIGMLAFQYGLISEPVFVAIIFSAVISSVIVGPWFSYSVKVRKEVSILEYFSYRAIVADFKSDKKGRAIEQLCSLVSEQEEISDAETVFGAVMAREDEMGTAIEEGIAVPHARMSPLRRSIVAFGRSVTGIDWDSPDGKPTNLVFLILTPQRRDDVQLQLLSLIAKAMSKKSSRQAIMQAKDAHEIKRAIQDIFTPHKIIRK